MVFVNIPAQLTEEELMLRQKYQMLKRKKKQLVQHKTPKNEKLDLSSQIPIKRSEASKLDAKEAAKRLLKSGAIQMTKQADKEKQDQGFKRKNMRRPIGIDKPGPIRSFSFSTSQDSSDDFSAEPSESDTSTLSSSSSFSPSLSKIAKTTSSSPTSMDSPTPATAHSWNSIAASYYKRTPKTDTKSQRETISYDDL